MISRGRLTHSASRTSSMPRESLALIAQLPEFPQFGAVHRRPLAEKDRHALVAIALCLLELIRLERGKVCRKVLDHAPVPCSLPAGFLSSPNHFRIFEPTLLRICIRGLISAAPGAMAMVVKAGRGA